MNQPRNINDILERLANVKSSGKDKWTSDCPCSGHSTPARHLSIADTGTKALVTCFNAHSFADICRALGFATLSYGTQDKQPHLIEVCHYDYKDYDGTLLYQIVRYIPKTFKVRRPDDNHGWKWGLGDVKPVLYHLPDILTAKIYDETIFVCEGEKDADNCFIYFGSPGTTCPFGARKWLPKYSEVLRGCNIIIVPVKFTRPCLECLNKIYSPLAGLTGVINCLRKNFQYFGKSYITYSLYLVWPLVFWESPCL